MRSATSSADCRSSRASTATASTRASQIHRGGCGSDRCRRRENPSRRPCTGSTPAAWRASVRSRSATAPTGTSSAAGCTTSIHPRSGSTSSTTTWRPAGSRTHARGRRSTPADGLPDGLTIDSEGCVWLALFQGGAVRRFDPDGRLMLDVALPTPFVTCPAFGGDDLSVLFVTSSQHKIPPRGAGRPPPGRRAPHDRDRRQRAALPTRSRPPSPTR